MLLEICTYISIYIYLCVSIYVYVYTAYVCVRVCIYTHFCFVSQSKSENLSAAAAIKVKRFLAETRTNIYYPLHFFLFFFTTYVYVNKPTSRSQRRKRFESTRPSRTLTHSCHGDWLGMFTLSSKNTATPQHSVLISQPMLRQDPRLKTLSCEESQFLFRGEENASAVAVAEAIWLTNMAQNQASGCPALLELTATAV